jgi:hypothetical protein
MRNVVLIGLGIGVGVLVLRMLPDIGRYIKISRM